MHFLFVKQISQECIYYILNPLIADIASQGWKKSHKYVLACFINLLVISYMVQCRFQGFCRYFVCWHIIPLNQTTSNKQSRLPIHCISESIFKNLVMTNVLNIFCKCFINLFPEMIVKYLIRCNVYQQASCNCWMLNNFFCFVFF